MRDETAREALLAALDADRGDAISINALGDWFEENGDQPAAACLRWVTRNARKPAHYPRQSDYGPFLWVRQGDQPIIDDRPAQLPEKLWLALKDNDEPHPVASFKSYQTARAAYLALVEAWRSLGEPVPDVGKG
jgi:hypothetical protein